MTITQISIDPTRAVFPTSSAMPSGIAAIIDQWR
jgi:hypothetical protein